MKKLLPMLIILSLSACGGGGGGSSNKQTDIEQDKTNNTPSGVVTNSETKLMITGNNNTATVAKSSKSEINISGDKNIIYIQSNIGALDIVGNGNTLEVSNGVTVDDCNVIGSDNKVVKPNGLTLTCKITGQNNTGFN